MSGVTIIKAETREEKGSGAVGRLRAAGRLPAVMYGAGKVAKSLSLEEHAFEQLMRSHSSEHVMVEMEIDGVKRTVLLKEVQHHPVTGRMLHADFQEVNMDSKLVVEIAIELVGEPEGVVQQGGVIEHLLRSVEVECLPGDIMESIQIDITALKIGDRAMVRDIKLDSKRYTMVTEGDLAIANVMPPRVQAATAEVAEGGAAEGAEA